MRSVSRHSVAVVLFTATLGAAAACGPDTQVVQGTAAGAPGAAAAPSTAAPSTAAPGATGSGGTTTGGEVGTATATAATATVGPGRIVHATPQPTPQPTTTSVLTGPVVVLGPGDDGRIVQVPVGTAVTLNLGGDGSSWDTPDSDDPAVLRETSHTGGYPAPGPIAAHYEAVAAGTAHITATSDAPCLHTAPRCMIAQREYRVTVEVRD